MIFKVYLTAFQDGACRRVRVPNADLCEWSRTKWEQYLDVIFHYGQNDVQNLWKRCSVSCGDVIEIEKGAPSYGDKHGGYYLVKPVGFARITPSEFRERMNNKRERR